MPEIKVAVKFLTRKEIEKEIEPKIKVAVMGLPKKDAWKIAEAVANSKDMELMPVSLTDSKTLIDDITVGGVPIRLFSLKQRQSMLFGISPDVVVDCMGLRTIQHNINFYDQNKLPFVAGHLAQKTHLIEETLVIIRSLPKKESENGNLPSSGENKDWSLGNHILVEEEKALQRETNEMLRRKSRRSN